MQRQSLGSPSHHTPSFQSSSTSTSFFHGEDLYKEDLKKPTASPLIRHNYLHLIPILTFLCFLILYLSSHAPSPHELADFTTYQISSTLPEIAQRVVEIKDGDVLARRLKELEATEKQRLRRRRHRKFSRA